MMIKGLTRICIFAVVIVVLPHTADAGRGGGAMQGSGPGGGQYDQPAGTGREIRKQKQELIHIHANTRQHGQLRTCLHSAERVRLQTRDMVRASTGSNFDNDKIRQQRENLRNEIRTMDEEHNRFLQGMNKDEKQQMKERIQNMEQQRERLNSRFREMDQELNRPEPDRGQIAQQTREMEDAMNELQKEYRKVASEMGVE